MFSLPTERNVTAKSLFQNLRQAYIIVETDGELFTEVDLIFTNKK